MSEPATVLVTGAAGMIGQKLIRRLALDGQVGGRIIGRLVAHDIIALSDLPSADFPIVVKTGDFAAVRTAADLVAERADIIFHLAGVVSGEAEADFDKGYRVNLDGTRQLFDAIRQASPGYHPRLVFASSMAVFGGPFPDIVPDDFHVTPLSSYGTQKMIGEALLADYTRKGFLNGVGIRLPTICVRPGKPNRAASGFFSSIIREPLDGKPATIPVSRKTVHTHASPRAAVDFLVHAAGLDGALIGPRRNLTMPGVAVSVNEQIEALERVAGGHVVQLIRDEPDEAVAAIVNTWPSRFSASRARELGFRAEPDFDTIIRVHLDDRA